MGETDRSTERQSALSTGHEAAERWDRIQAVFLESIEQDPEKRADFLASACGSDDGLRAEVESMLAAHGDSQALDLEGALVRDGSADEESAGEPELGSHIGHYRLVEHLGRGGMADVYLATRDDGQYRQQVAVKLARPGFGADLVARFRTERQILAQLTHPHIAPLLDGGVSDDGRPYLVMQHVEGVPLTTYCQERELSVEQRLRLFLQVCEALQLAHRHLVVHRDLKPSNILVTEPAPGGAAPGHVKLLDFGIAKLLDKDTVDASALVTTRYGEKVMTPEYAAPEQFLGEPITTATDIYTLGVLLCELLTGRRPRRYALGTPVEVEGLDGDLKAIAEMALRETSLDRYASVDALQEDIERFLAGRPVSARPNTLGYRVAKFVGRNWAAVAAGALVLVLVLGFGVAMAVQATRLAQRGQELEEERDLVRRQVETTTRVKALVSELFKWVDPNEAHGGPADQLQAASRRIVQSLDDEPKLQAELMDEVLTIYINLGLYGPALEMAEASLDVRRSAFGAREPPVAWGQHRLGEALFLNGRFDAAQQQYEEALALQRDALGDRHVDVARSLVRLARLHGHVGRHLVGQDCAEEALSILEAAFGRVDARTADALYELAVVRKRLAGPEPAETLLREVVAVRREVLGADHPDVAWALTSLGSVLMEQGRFDEAEPVLREALASHRARYGDDHPDVSRTQFQIARLHQDQKEFGQAETHYREVLAARRTRLGDRHVATGSAMVSLGEVLTQQGAYAEAEELLLEALPIFRPNYGFDHRLSRSGLQALVALYEAWGRPDSAMRYRRLLEPEPTS